MSASQRTFLDDIQNALTIALLVASLGPAAAATTAAAGPSGAVWLGDFDLVDRGISPPKQIRRAGTGEVLAEMRISYAYVSTPKEVKLLPRLRLDGQEYGAIAWKTEPAATAPTLLPQVSRVAIGLRGSSDEIGAVTFRPLDARIHDGILYFYYAIEVESSLPGAPHGLWTSGSMPTGFHTNSFSELDDSVLDWNFDLSWRKTPGDEESPPLLVRAGHERRIVTFRQSGEAPPPDLRVVALIPWMMRDLQSEWMLRLKRAAAVYEIVRKHRDCSGFFSTCLEPTANELSEIQILTHGPGSD